VNFNASTLLVWATRSASSLYKPAPFILRGFFSGDPAQQGLTQNRKPVKQEPKVAVISVVTHARSKQPRLNVKAWWSMFQSNHQLLTQKRQLTTLSTTLLRTLSLHLQVHCALCTLKISFKHVEHYTHCTKLVCHATIEEIFSQNLVTHNHHNRFTALFPGPPR